jgi:diguanylate cyclase (GGDEF)-like protein/PAS domain S-box-containing protein
MFATILQKALNSVSSLEQQKIDDKWRTSLEVPVDDTVLIQFSLFFFVILSLLLGWVVQVKHRNKKIKATQKILAETNLALTKVTSSLEQKVLNRTEKLSQSESKYRNLVENLRDEYFFYQRDLQGNYRYVSPSITNLLGYKQEYFLENADNIFTNNVINQNTKNLASSNNESNSAIKFEIELRALDGENHQFMVVENVMRDHENNNIGVEGIAQDITSLNKTQAQLNWLSYFDDLTQLANRRLFLVQFEQLINIAHRNSETLALLFLDLNRFKIINDNLGHLTGDEVLKESALRIKSALRESDIAARIGGDEFTIILPQNNAVAAEQVAKKLIACLAAPYVIKEKNYVLGASVGIALFPENGMDATTLIQQADSAMYYAKHNKLGYSFCSPEQVLTNSRHLQIEQQLRRALTAATFDDEFELNVVYQPKVSLNSMAVEGYEALIRWNHPELGTVSPIEFIPIAEETGVITSLSEWIIEKVCRQALRWYEDGFNFGKIAINISAVELLNLQLADNIVTIIEGVGARAEWIEIEVTESALIKAPEVATTVLNNLAKYNIFVAIDDFGTGYSSLSYLKNIPAKYIKIDKSFIDNVLENKEDKEVVRAIIAMSHALGKLVIAEGVETKAQLHYLLEQQCDFVQGYWFSKPRSASEIVTFQILEIQH